MPQYRKERCRMRLFTGLVIITVVFAVLTISQAKQSKSTSKGSKSQVSHTAKHGSTDHAKKPHQETVHSSDHTKASQSHKPKRADKAKKTEQKHKPVGGSAMKMTTKKPELKNKQRHEGKRRTTALPVVVHRKHQGTNVTNNGTSGVGSIIDAPLISCPEGQRRVKGECKMVFR